MRGEEQMEGWRSPFEERVRKLPLPAAKAFRSHKPIAFSPKGKLAAQESITGSFSNTIRAHGQSILIAGKPLRAPAHKLRVAVLFSGGPAAGGHNVIVGLKRVLGKNALLGVRGGPRGLLAGDLFPITDADVKRVTNTGGFDLLGTDRTKIRTDEQIRQVREACIRHRVDAIVIIGGDDSNTNAALLAERLFRGVHPNGRGVQVIGVPKTMDGDLQHGKLLPIPFGFDTACRVYAELVGNILQDMASSRKYWHFVRLMGRSASHVTLEVALQTKPTVALISEEVAARNMTLNAIVEQIANTIITRSKAGRNYGLILVPEGLIEFVPEMNTLIADIGTLMARHGEIARMGKEERVRFLWTRLPSGSAALLQSLPAYVQQMLVAERDAHGNMTVSQIETEKLLVELVAKRVKQLAPDVPFATNTHFFGYEGRCGAPTLFDARYAYNLGLTAGSLVLGGHAGYLASVTLEGKPVAIPLTGMLTLETRKGAQEMVIKKALVRLDSKAFQHFASRRAAWASADCCCSPGPRQFWGPVSYQVPISVGLNQK